MLIMAVFVLCILPVDGFYLILLNLGINLC